MSGWLRGLAALLLLAVASLAIWPGSAMKLWLLSIGVREFGHWIFWLPLLILIGVSPWRPLGLMLWFFAIAAAALLASSTIWAFWFARTLPARLEAAFGAPTTARVTLNWPQLWLGEKVLAIAPERFIYARRPGAELALFLWRSAARKDAPCVVLLHGGGWNSGTPEEFQRCNEKLAAAGYAVAALEYRLAPRWVWPAPREDVLAALEYLKAQHAALGISGTQFVLMGRSAGGQIAEAVAVGGQDPTIRGCVAFYAPADLEFAYRFAETDDMLHSRRLLRQYLGGPPKEQPAQYRDASPIDFVSPKTPPVLLMHGTNDPLVWNRQSRRFADQLAKAKVPHFLLELPWATHGSDFNPDGPTGQLSTAALLYFLHAVVP